LIFNTTALWFKNKQLETAEDAEDAKEC